MQTDTNKKQQKASSYLFWIKFALFRVAATIKTDKSSDYINGC